MNFGMHWSLKILSYQPIKSSRIQKTLQALPGFHFFSKTVKVVQSDRINSFLFAILAPSYLPYEA